MMWECFYVKDDTFETAAWKKALAGGRCRKLYSVIVMVNIGKIDYLLFLWTVIIGYQTEIKRKVFFSHKRDYFHTKFLNT